MDEPPRRTRRSQDVRGLIPALVSVACNGLTLLMALIYWLVAAAVLDGTARGFVPGDVEVIGPTRAQMTRFVVVGIVIVVAPIALGAVALIFGVRHQVRRSWAVASASIALLVVVTMRVL